MPHRPERRRPAALALATVAVSAAVVLAASGDARDGDATRARAGAAVGRAAEPSVVDVLTTLGGARGSVAATGVVLSAGGVVLTNNHVIAGATAVSVRVPSTGRWYGAAVVGYDVADDVAVLHVRGVSGLSPARLGERDRLRAGDRVVAVGNRDGRGGAPVARPGTVVALDQRVDVDGEAGREHLSGMVAFAAPVRGGDSGGPLLDHDGRVVALVTATSGTPGAPVGYAIPIRRAAAIARDIAAGRSSATVHAGPRAVLGIAIKNTRAGPGAVASGGAVIGLVDTTGPGFAIGLRAGDVVLSVDGTAVRSAAELNRALDGRRPGQIVTVSFRDAHGRTRTGAAQLVAGPPL